MDRLADDLHIERRIQAELILAQALPQAALVKVDGLKEKDARVRQDAASDILDRGLGKATQRQEITGKDGGPIETKEISDVISKLLPEPPTS